MSQKLYHFISSLGWCQISSITHVHQNDMCCCRLFRSFLVIRQYHHCPATGTKLYCLVTEAHVCEQFGHLTAARPRVELATSGVASQRLNHYTTRPHSNWDGRKWPGSKCVKLIDKSHHHDHHHHHHHQHHQHTHTQPFYGPLSGTTQVS